MVNFNIMRYLKRWWKLIAALSLICCVGFYMYISSKQTYTAITMISYIGINADQGITPTGEKIDVDRIYSSDVISKALEELDLHISVDSVRSNIKVQPVISSDEQTLKDAMIEAGKEYTTFPTQYLVSYKVTSDYSAGFARQMLDAVLGSYLKLYSEKYVDSTVIPNNNASALDSSYDYLECAEIIDESVSDIISCLYDYGNKYPLYWSSATGYNFSSLHAQYKYLYDNGVQELYSLIYDTAGTRDSELLLEKYKARRSDCELNKTTLSEKITKIEELIEQYSGKSQLSTEAQEQLSANLSYVLNTIAGDYKGRKLTTYDDLMTCYSDYLVKYDTYTLNSEYCDYVISVFSSKSASKNTAEAQERIGESISDIMVKADELYGILLNTVSELNDYLATEHIRVSSGISIRESVNVKLYTLIAFVFFVLVGAVMMTVFGRASEIISYGMYTDAKTGLPNRSCLDREIDRLRKHPLPENTVCIACNLANLFTVNDVQGREYGDLLLKNFGLILKSYADDYGMIAYNGGSVFVGIFENCTIDRGEYFKQNLTETVEKYNSEYPDAQIKLICVVDESGDSKRYDIRDMLRHLLSALNEAGKGVSG